MLIMPKQMINSKRRHVWFGRKNSPAVHVQAQTFPLRDQRRRRYCYKRRLSFVSFAPGYRYLEDAPAAASLSDSSKIVFQTDRKAGGHRRARECGSGERVVRGRGIDIYSVCKTRRRVDPTPSASPPVSSLLSRSSLSNPSFSLPLSPSLFRPLCNGDPSGLPVTLASTTISTGQRRYSVSVLVAAEPAAPIHW